MGFDFLDFGFPKSGTDWKSINGKPHLTVSDKGISNGLSHKINNGADFGPDTTLGAMSPNQIGPPYSKTSGIQEYVNYVSTLWQYNPGSSFGIIYLSPSSRYVLNADVVFPNFVYSSPIISTWAVIGAGTNFNTEITLDTGCTYGLDFSNLQPDSGSGANVILNNFTIRALVSGLTSHVNANLPSGSGNNGIYISDMQIAGSSSQGIGVSNFQQVLIDNIVNADMLSSAGYFTFGGAIDTIYMTRQSAFGVINVNNSPYPAPPINLFHFDSLFSDVAIIFNQPVNIVELQGENHNVITYQGAANVKYIKLHNYIYISPTLSSPFFVNTGYQPVVDVDGFFYNIPSGTVPFFDLGSSGVNPIISTVQNVFNIGSGTITMPPTSITLPANPPVSGTVYQNTNPTAIRIKIPVTYSPTSTASATLATGISSTSTVTTSTKVNIPAGLTTADGEILTYDMVVPSGWYYELVATNATIGTAEVQPA